MKLIEAVPILRSLYKVKFSELFEKCDMKTDKGKVGKLLQQLLDLPTSSKLLDFEDGELKTNKSKPSGEPKETIFISQISKRIDFLLDKGSFANSWIFSKIKNLIYLPVVKEGATSNWYFLYPIHVEIRQGDELFKQLSHDFNAITSKMIFDIEEGSGGLHTSNGKFVQIRTKDSKPYSPIYSRKYDRFISNKNFAFYFRKEFMVHLLKKSGDYPNIV